MTSNTHNRISEIETIALRIRSLARAAESEAMHPSRENEADSQDIVIGLAESIAFFSDLMLDKLEAIERHEPRGAQ